jgi:hypothetical protein
VQQRDTMVLWICRVDQTHLNIRSVLIE